MKIELNCAFCSTVLRVDQEHSGKQVRCPSCQGLTRIPEITDAELATSGPGATRPASRYQAPMSDWKQPIPDYATPFSPSSPNGRSSRDIVSLVLGIGGIFLNVGCSCLFPVWLILNVYGLFMAVRSKGPFRTAAMITNLVAMIIGLVMGLLFGIRMW